MSKKRNYKTIYDKSQALVVGVDEYEHLRNLDTAVRGANAVAEVLDTTYGFETTILLNDHVSRESIVGWFNELQPGPDDRVIFYFAGHGLSRRIDNNAYEGYLAMPETPQYAYRTALWIEELIREADDLRAKHVLLILDACFGGLVFGRARSIETDPEMDTQQLVDALVSRRVRYALTAGGVEAVDDNLAPGGAYSLFTYFLLNALQGGLQTDTGLVRARTLGSHLEEQVASHRKSRHKPNHGYFSGELGGDFVLRLPEHLLPIDDSLACHVSFQVKHVPEGPGHVASVLGRLRRTKMLQVLKEIKTGQSGSVVYLVNATARPSWKHEGLHYCKVYRTETGTESENHQRVSKTAIGKYVPRLVDTSPVIDKWMASLYSVAHGTDLAGSQPLSRLIRDNMLAAVTSINRLVDVLREWNPQPSVRQLAEPIDLMQRTVRRWMSGSGIVDEDIPTRIEKNIRGLTPHSVHIQFVSEGRGLPNPLAFLTRRDLWTQTRDLLWPLGHTHGDLHSNNILCPLDAATGNVIGYPVIIDFDTYEEDNCVLFDLAYLEIDIGLRMIDPGDLENRSLWIDISDYLAQGISLPELPPLGAAYVPFHLLITPLRQLVMELCQQEPGDFEVAYWICRASAGLSFARKRKVGYHQRQLALLISAHSLKRALDILGIGTTGREQPYWMGWLVETAEEGLV